MSSTENSIETVIGDLGNRLSSSFEAENFSELKDSVLGMFDELTLQLKEEPLQTIAASVALGFFAVSLIRTKGRPLSRNIGRGLGAAIANRIFEKFTAPKEYDYGIDKQLRH